MHGDTLVVVGADGGGGLGGGSSASDAVVDAVRAMLSATEFDPTDVRAWSACLARIDVALARALGGETTAVIVAVGDYGVLGVSVGDSEAWTVSSDRIDRLTAAQTRHRLGSGRATPIAFHRRMLDGTLVVGTDGLFKYVDAAVVGASCHGRVADIADRLADSAKLSSGEVPDDVAVVVVAPAPLP